MGYFGSLNRARRPTTFDLQRSTQFFEPLKWVHDSGGGTCDFSACQYHCTSPAPLKMSELRGAGFAIDREREPVVTSVLRQSPADIAGIRPGDKLVSIDAQVLPITCKRAFADEVSHTCGLRRGLRYTPPELQQSALWILLHTVHDLYFDPQYEEFRSRTIWSLSSAFTSAFKELELVPQFRATAKLGEFLETRFSQTF